MLTVFLDCLIQSPADEEGLFWFSLQVSEPEPGTAHLRGAKDLLFSLCVVTFDDLPPQMNPDRRRLRRGETVEVCSPAAGLDSRPRPRERPLGRCHTLDSGEETPEPPAGHTPQDVAHAPRMTPRLQPDDSDTHSTVECSTASPPSTNTPPHADNQSVTNTPVITSHELSSHSLCLLDGQSPDKHNINEHTADLRPPTEGGDQEEVTSATSGKSSPEGGD